MKQKTKEIVKWIKDRVFDVEQNCQFKIDDNDKYISIMSKCDEAIKFLDSLPDIESHLCKGGYIQDRNGTPCCNNDEVLFEGFMVRNKGILKWDSTNAR